MTSIRIYQRAGYEVRSPKDFKVYGTNDGTNWVELINITNATYSSYIHTSYTTNQITSYTTFGIVVNRIFGGNIYDNVLNFDELEFYGYSQIEKSIKIFKNVNELSFQINNTPVYQTPYNLDNTWTHILWNIKSSTTSPSIRINNGKQITYSSPDLLSGTYINKLGSVNNQGTLYIADFKIINQPLTPDIHLQYDKTQFANKEYVADAIKNIDGLYYNDTKAIEANTNGITVYGNLTATNDIVPSYSDIRLKHVSASIENPLDKLMQIKTFKYCPNALAKSLDINDNKIRLGVSAQDVQSVLPEVVELAPFDSIISNTGRLVSKSSSNYLSVSYERIVPLLIEGIKELKKEIDAHKQKNKNI